MASNNAKLNIRMDPIEITIIKKLAKQANKSVSDLAKELMREALELREDMILSALATERDGDDIQTMPHEEAWK